MKNFLFLLLFFVFTLACNQRPKVNVKSRVVVDSTNEKLIKINRYLTKKDEIRIRNYAERRNWSMQLDSNGYFYEILKEGKGELAQDKMIATISYRLDLLEGRTCYSSDSTGLIRFKVGFNELFSGIDKGILKLRKGGKARFIFPPFWAYGLIGDQKCIPARSSIIYEVELINLEY